MTEDQRRFITNTLIILAVITVIGLAVTFARHQGWIVGGEDALPLSTIP